MHLVFIGGSLGGFSLNRRLMDHLAGQATSRGHAVRIFAGEDLRLPFYEDGAEVPSRVKVMAEAMGGSQGVVIVSPEYNAGIPAHLKNALDWLSTQQPNPWKELPVLLASATTGAFGGARGIQAWRICLANVGAWTAPGAILVPRADVNLAEDGAPREDRTSQGLQRALEAFFGVAERMGRPLLQPRA